MIRCSLYASGGTSQLLDQESVSVVKDIDNLTQDEVFNILTNNGQAQGIYMQNEKLYINGSYIGVGKIASHDGKTYFDLDNNQLVISGATNGKVVIDTPNFKIDEDGNVSVKGSGDFDGSFNVDVPIEGLPDGESASMYIGIDDGAVTMGVKGQATESGNPTELAMTYYGEVHLVGGSVYIGGVEGAYDYPLNLEGNTLLAGDLKVTGNLEVGIESTLNGDVRCQNSLYSTQVPQTGSRNDSNGMGQQGRLVSTDLNHYVCFEWITYGGANWLNGFVDVTSLGAVQFSQ